MKTAATFYKLLKIVLSIIALNYSILIQAQQLNFNVLDQPSSVAACVRNTYQVQFTNSDTISLSITPIITSVNETCGDLINNYVNVIVESSTANIINGSFNTDSGKWFGQLIGSGVEDTVVYSIIIDCSIVPPQNNVSMDLKQVWKNGQTIIKLDGKDTLTSIGVQFPYFVNPGAPVFDANYLQEVDWTFDYINTGTSGANISFWFDATLNNDSCDTTIYIPMGITWTTGIDSGIYQPGISVFVPSNDTLKLSKSVKMIGCINSCNTGKATFAWRCDTAISPNPLDCDSCQGSFSKPFSLHTEPSPGYRVDRLAPSEQMQNYDTICGVPLEWRMAIVNTSSQTTFPYLLFELEKFLGNSLTLIDTNSISVECDSCMAEFNYKLLNNTPPSCNSAFQTNLYVASLKFHNFAPGDTVIVNFSTYRCCSEDTSLLNQPKAFNYWRQLVRAFTICDTIINVGYGIGPTQSNPVFGFNSGLSTNFLQFGQHIDIHQVLDFSPTVTDLTVQKGPDPQFGPSADFTINFRRLFYEEYDKQVLGYSPPGDTVMSGILRATIRCDKGLRVEDLYNDVTLVSDSGSWTPTCFYTVVNDSLCEAGEFVFYFNLDSLYTAGLDPNLFFKKGRFNFRLQACCTSTEPASFEVIFHLLMNNCETLLCNGIQSVPTCNNCCWLPLSSVGHNIKVHCPGCIAPGIIVDSYSLQRRSFGFEDTNDNQLADSPVTEIDFSSYVRRDELNTFSSIHGDVLEDLMVAHFEPGDPSAQPAPGYSYSDFILPNGVLHALQLSRVIPYSEDSMMNLTVTGFDFYIDNPSSSGCIDCDLFDLDSTQHQTILHLAVADSSIGNYLEKGLGGQDANQYFFTFIDTLLVNDPNLNYIDTSFGGFVENQIYRLSVRYSVCGNIEGSIWSSDPEQFLRKSEISNIMWLSGTKHSFNAYANIPLMPSSFSALSPNYADTMGNLIYPQQLADDHLFLCETFGGMHFFYGVEYLNETSYYYNIDTLCQSRVITNLRSSIARNLFGDIFPYEFRVPPIRPMGIRSIIPDGYSISTLSNTGYINSKPYVWSDHNYNLNFHNPISFTLPQPDTNGMLLLYLDSLLIDSINYLTFNCQNDVSPYPGAFVGDQSDYHVVYYDLSKDISCDTVIDTLTMYHNQIIYASSFSSCGITQSINNCNLVDTLPIQVLQSNSIIRSPNPVLALNIDPVNISNKRVCWDFQLENLTYWTEGALNIFIAVPDSHTVNYFDNWYILSNSDTLYPNNNIFYLATALNNPNSPMVTGTLCAEMVGCVDSIFMPIYFGWSCSGMIDSLSKACFIGLDSVFIETDDVNITSINSTADSSFNLCEPFKISACFKSVELGDSYPHQVIIDSIPPGISVDTVKIYSCQNSNLGNISIILDTVSSGTWIITDSILSIITDSVLETNECICIEATLTAECTFANSLIELPDIQLNTLSYCNDLITATANFSHDLIHNGNNCTSCFTINKTVMPEDSASVGDTVMYSIEICNNNGSTQNVSIVDYIPTGFIIYFNDLDSLGNFALDTGCTTFNISGFFDTIADCNSTTNIAWLYFGNDSVSDDACLNIYDVQCAIGIGGEVTNTTTAGGNNGAIDITILGGTAPFTYLWSTNATTQDISNLNSGNYSVTVTDMNGCTATEEFLVSEPCEGFRTQTQGGWGQPPNKHNNGGYMQANFGLYFPNGLIIGCDTNTFTLTNAKAVTEFLPSGSTPTILPTGNIIDSTLYENVFAGQVVALTLSLVFDLNDSSFAISNNHLQDLIINSGTFQGWTVQELLDEANLVLGGCPSIYTPAIINPVISDINACYVPGGPICNLLSCDYEVGQLRISSFGQNGTNSQRAVIGTVARGGELPYFYQWNTGDSAAYVHDVPTGTYYITVTDSDNNTITDSVSVIAFTDTIYSVIPGFNYSINSINGSLSITDTSYSDCSITSYLYGFYPLGDTSTIMNPVFDYDTAGVYTVCQTIVSTCNDEQVYMRGKCEDISLPVKISTKLSTGSCNITVSTLGQILSSDVVSGATNYRYRVTKTGSSFIYTRWSGSNLFSIGWINGIEYAQTYNVEVAAFVGGTWSDYGPVCTVTTPANIPTTKLTSQYCNYSLTSLSQVISCDQVHNATNYQYHIFNDSLNFEKYYNRGSSSNLFSLSWISGIQNGITYSITVKAYGGFWGNFGDTCLVTVPHQSRVASEISSEISTLSIVSNDIKILPNPNDGNFIIEFESVSSGKVEVKLLNMLGQSVDNLEHNTNEGINIIRFNSGNIPKGVYFLKIFDGNTNKLARVILQ